MDNGEGHKSSEEEGIDKVKKGFRDARQQASQKSSTDGNKIAEEDKPSPVVTKRSYPTALYPRRQ